MSSRPGWLFILGEHKATEWVLKHETMGFRGSASGIDIRVGDRLLIYVTRGALNNPRGDESQIVGYGKITEAVSPNKIVIGGRDYGATCGFHLTLQFPLRHGLPFAPLVPSLDFISNKKAWYAYIRRAVVQVPSPDVEKIVVACDHLDMDGGLR